VIGVKQSSIETVKVFLFCLIKSNVKSLNIPDKNMPLIFKKLIKKSELIISGSCSFFFKKSMKSTISFLLYL